MENLPPNPSADDIAFEIAVCETQLDTLDYGAHNYEEERQQLEDKRSTLVDLMNSKSTNHHESATPSQPVMSPGFDLPSREKASNGSSGKKRRPSTQQTPSNRPKAQRTRGAFDTGTPTSRSGSVDSASTSSQQATTGFEWQGRDAFWKKMTNLVSEKERRLQMEREDEAFARSLQESEQSSSAASAFASNGYSQSFLGPSGSYTHPGNGRAANSTIESPSSSAAASTKYPSLLAASAISQPSYQASSRSNGAWYPPYNNRPGPSKPVGYEDWLYDDNGDDEDDEELSMIPADQFYRSTNSPHKRSSTAFYNLPDPMSMPGAFPQTARTLPMGYAPQETQPHVHGLGGASVFDDAYDYRPFLNNLEEWYDSAQERTRPYGYEPPDPAQTQEELRKLLENIRPDEELPPELQDADLPGLRVKLMQHQEKGLQWLKQQEEGSNKGGILADDMGLGKTIQALALIVSRPSPDPAQKTTLVIAPVALMKQWAREIDTRMDRAHKLRVHTYHGTGKKMKFAQLSQFDVVLTTYGSVAAEHMRKLKAEKAHGEGGPPVDNNQYPLFGKRSMFYRIILDEAQCIKNKLTRSAQAASSIKATYRLCLTGTPMMNGIVELYSLIRFLRIPPYEEWEVFSRAFVKPLGNGSKAQSNALRKFQVVVRSILLRRTKDSKINGHPILSLPERNIEFDHPTFDDDQRDFYKALEEKNRLQFNKYLKSNTVGKNYSNVLVLLLRLRQACCHPHLIKDHSEPVDSIDGQVTVEDQEELAGKLAAGPVAMIKNTEAFECPICYDATEAPKIFFPCGHHVCTDCLARMTDPAYALSNGTDGVDAKCPQCRAQLDMKRIINYDVFKKVHMPEKYAEEQAGVDDGVTVKAEGNELGSGLNSDHQEESDDSSDSSDSDDSDDGADLRDFIVPDDVDEDDESDKDNKSKIGDSSQKQKSSKSTNRKTKKSAKAKGKQPKIKKTLAELKKESLRNQKAKQKYLARLRKDFVSSAKIDRTVEILQGIRENDPTEKTIIFSQFTSFLDLLEVALSAQNLKVERYDGSMSPKLRNDAVVRFTDNPENRTMLVSLKAGNAGLNLNCASQVVILDPFWNPFIEEQAIDRCHRIGQLRNVTVHRVLVKGTVEDRICQLQEDKRERINQALDEKAGKELSRLSMQDLTFLFNGNGDEDL